MKIRGSITKWIRHLTTEYDKVTKKGVEEV
jgi:hypothetical protein